MTQLDPWRDAINVLPVLRRPDGYRVLVVAPHPDDETLGLGGLIYDWRRAGLDIRVLIVSDGGASHRHAQLADIRKAEALAAAEALGMGDRFTFLDLADGELLHQRVEIGEAIRAYIPTDGQQCVVLAPRLRDGHPDHEACAVAAADVTASLYGVELWSYGVWTWTQIPQNDSLLGARRWLISADGYEAKWKAIALYASQVSAMLGEQIVSDQLLATMDWATEVVWC